MSSATKNLLVELFVEELPPKALKKLGESFAASFQEHLELNDFLEADSVTVSFASPRRLGVHISNVRPVSQPKPKPPEMLMPEAVALKDGVPTAALTKRLQKAGYHDSIDIASLFSEGRLFVADEGGKRVIKHDPGQAAGSQLTIALQGALDLALHRLPIPKVMTYQLADGWSDVKFVRPAHSLLALHGADVVPVSALGLNAGRETRGHRFEAAVERLQIESADSYARQLAEQGAVIASFTERRAELLRQLQAAAANEGLKPIEDEALLDEVTALVERPNVLTCQFETEFLAVPQECLILTMKANQKYFPLLDGQGRLTHKFLVVSNIKPADASAVIGGNERVVRPRLSDAKFFFDQDRKKSLVDRVPGLAKVVYHGKLGTQGERVERVRAIAKAIAEMLGGGTLSAQVDQAAHLAKADLLTDMVGEFPELQGIMGGYYARHDGLAEAVAFAIEDHYKPRFAGDELPRNEVGLIVALADKLETLVGLFGIGQLPTGDKDPFALRRHALGVVRMLSEGGLSLDLNVLVEAAFGVLDDPSVVDEYHERQAAEQLAERTAKAAPGAVIASGYGRVRRQFEQGTPSAVTDFIFDRLAGALREQGYSAKEVDAVLALRPQRLADVGQRLAAVRTFAALPEAESLAAANKRIANILKKVETPVEARIDAALLTEAAEQHLATALKNVQPIADSLFHAGHYEASLRELAMLKGPVDAFFDGVMVNAEDPALRANRLGLLKTLHEAMNRVADLSRLAS